MYAGEATPESRYALCGTGHAEGSLVRSGFILEMYVFSRLLMENKKMPSLAQYRVLLF